MDNGGHRYWVVLVVDNSVPKPEPEGGFWPMHMNAAPLLKSAEDGGDALCVFTSEGLALDYGHAAADDPTSPAAPATLIPLASREDFERFMGEYRPSHVVLDPPYGAVGESVFLAEFLDGLK
jgi:hypothetical protein